MSEFIDHCKFGFMVQPHKHSLVPNMGNRPVMPLMTRDKTGTSWDKTGTSRDKTGTSRDKTGTSRDKIGTNRDKTGTSRDKTGTEGTKQRQ